MPTFSKQILKPGKYLARNLHGERVEFTVTPERIQHWVETFQDMKKAGLKVPAPWKHDKEAKPSQGDKDSRDNAGYWEDLFIQDNDLYGKVNVPRDEDASRVGTSIQEVSPFVRPKWTDGVGKDWRDSIQHIALVQHPVVPSQENFGEEIKRAASYGIAASLSLLDYKGEVVLAEEHEAENTTSEADSTPATSPSIQNVLAALASCKLVLPSDTTAENLAERIVVAATAISKADEDEEESEETKEQPAPIALSNEDTMTKDSNAVLALATTHVKRSFQSRIDILLKKGSLTPKYNKEVISPLLEGFELSLGKDGEPTRQDLDIALDTLEQVPTSIEVNKSAIEEENPFSKDDDEHDEESNEKAADSMIEAAGLPV